jgi:hypothetical protein
MPPSLTIFAIPKRFEGHFALIQGNAVRSWAALAPRPDIVLLGSDAGTAEIAAEVGARHIADVVSSPSGAPRFDDVLRKGQLAARTDLVCFINADIVLTPEWLAAVHVAGARPSRFLMVGRRWNLDVLEPLPFDRPGWSADLTKDARSRGHLATNMTIDYFVFPRGMLMELPPFVIGRPGYDNWLLWSVRKAGIPLVDATDAAPVIHQNHDYSHIKADRSSTGGTDSFWRGEDTRQNAELAGGWTRSYTTDHSTHVVRDGEVRPAFERRYLDARIETARRHVVDFTRPVRRVLGIDEAAVNRLRARFTRR